MGNGGVKMINKSELFKRAWAKAEKMVRWYHMPSSQRKMFTNIKYKNLSDKKAENFALALRITWAEMKEEANRVTTTISKGRRSDRYVELLETAKIKGLNHGRSWRASSRDVDVKGINPSWEGEQICYVYVA
jgi:hypothetical protein